MTCSGARLCRYEAVNPSLVKSLTATSGFGDREIRGMEMEVRVDRKEKMVPCEVDQ